MGRKSPPESTPPIEFGGDSVPEPGSKTELKNDWVSFRYRFNIVFLPYILLAATLTLVYTVFVKIFLMKDGLYVISEQAVQFWIPSLIVWIPLIALMRRRLRVLRLKNGQFGRMFLMGGAIAVPMIAAQFWLDATSGDLVHVSSISAVALDRQDKYFTTDSLFTDVNKYSSSSTTRVIPRARGFSDLQFVLCVVIPLRNSSREGDTTFAGVWLGEEFSATVSTIARDSKKEEKWKELWQSSFSELARTDFNRYQYLERIGDKNVWWPVYTAAIAKNPLGNGHTPLTILRRRTEPLQHLSLRQLQLMCASSVLATLLVFLMVVFSKLDVHHLRQFQHGDKIRGEPAQVMFRAFIPQRNFLIVPALIDANIFVFLLMAFSGTDFTSFGGDHLIRWGASFGPLIRQGEWWRLLTSVFIHQSVIHLFNNMVFLYIAGLFLEPVVGAAKTIVTYFATGITANLISFLYHPDLASVGASGAIFGLLGFWTFCAKTKRRGFESVAPVLTTIIAVTAGVNILLGFLPGLTDNVAHIAGFLSGVLMAVVLVPKEG